MAVRETNNRVGLCYALAGNAVAFGPDGWVLVHGTIQGMGYPPNPHAWVIRNGIVWDPVLDQEFDPDVWQLFASPVEWTRYDGHAVRKQIRTANHWGPWGDDEQRYIDAVEAAGDELIHPDERR